MFKRKTLLILGAGASAELGLPLGWKLAAKIAELLKLDHLQPVTPHGNRLLFSLYEKYPLANNAYHQAARAISEGVTLANSIDDYLDRHAQDKTIQIVGKAAIVRSILTAERESRLYKALADNSLSDLNDTWYPKFFRMLGARVNVSNARQIFDNVSFIIFNYDRCLEAFLIAALRQVYGMGVNEAVATLADCDMLHPYGVVADLPFQRQGIPFGGGDDDYNWDCVTPSANIKIFTEQIAAGELLQQLHAKLFWAEQIVFLGFGYVEENLVLLRPADKMQLKPVFGTAFGMSDNSIDEVKDKLALLFSGGRQGILPAMQVYDRECTALFDEYALRLPI